MKRTAFVLIALFSAAAFADGADPAVSDVAVSQAGRVISVRYTLTGADAIVTATFRTNGVIVDCGLPFRMVGDVARKVEAGGERAFYWAPDLSQPDFEAAAGALSVEVKAWPLSMPPAYLAVDLTTKSNCLFFAEAESVPGTVTNDLYRTDWIVMRHIPASSTQWRMGCDSSYPAKDANWEIPHYVTMTKDYYIGIFELTQGQYYRITGNRPSQRSITNGYADGDLKPLETENFRTVRGSELSGFNWPKDGHKVSDTSFMGKIRKLTGIEFDFPTEVQWEYACRAGAGTFCYAGNTLADAGDVAWNSDDAADGYGEAQPHVVGTKPPNAFGLYDMLGNVYEFAIDWFTNDLTSVEFAVDSVGPTNGTERVTRGGNFTQPASYQRCSYRRKCQPNGGSPNNGYRLYCPCPALEL